MGMNVRNNYGDFIVYRGHLSIPVHYVSLTDNTKLLMDPITAVNIIEVHTTSHKYSSNKINLKFRAVIIAVVTTRSSDAATDGTEQ